jgi:hypothetical protein
MFRTCVGFNIGWDECPAPGQASNAWRQSTDLELEVNDQRAKFLTSATES